MATTDFYVSKGAGASDLNGGGPRLGANDAPVYTIASGGGLGCDSNADGTDLTDNSGNDWAGVQVDDWLCFDTAGVKEVLRVSAINDDIVTPDPTASFSLTDKAVRVCGAWATIDYAAGVVSNTHKNAAGDPPRVLIKQGTYAEAVHFDTNSGTSALPITFEAADGAGTVEIDADGSGDNATHFQASYIRLIGIYAHTNGNSKHPFYVQTGDYLQFYSCFAEGTGTSSTGFFVSGGYAYLHNCRTLSATADGFRLGGSNLVIGCSVDACGVYGFNIASASSAVINCIVDSPGSHCYYTNERVVVLRNCVGYGSTAGSGIYIGGTYSIPRIENCIFESNNRYGIEVNADWIGYEDYNAFYGNGIAERLNVLFPGANDVTQVAGSYFVDAVGGDFRLNNTAGRGALCRTTGFPGTLVELP